MIEKAKVCADALLNVMATMKNYQNRINMKTIKILSDDELRYGVERCKARLAGIMPMGLMTIEATKKALSEYMNELILRGKMELEFEL